VTDLLTRTGVGWHTTSIGVHPATYLIVVVGMLGVAVVERAL
jgi:hypothetical protein